MNFHSTKLEQLSKTQPPAYFPFSKSDSKRPRATHKTLTYAGDPIIREVKLPFGANAFSKTVVSGNRRDKSGLRSSLNYHLTFIPPRWFSTLILQWEFCFRYVGDGFPVLGISVSPIRHNSHPLLVKAVKSCDVKELQKLFRCGLARPDDYLLSRRRPMLLLEVLFISHS